MNPNVVYMMGLGSLTAGLTLFFFFNVVSLAGQFRVMRESHMMEWKSRLAQFRYFISTQKNMPALNAICALILGLLGLGLHIGIFGALLGGLIGWFLSPVIKNHLRNKRLQRLNIQFVQALSLLANGMKAGESLTQAIESTRRIMTNPMAQELSIIAGQIRLGVTPNRALDDFAGRVPLSDVKIATSAMLISIRTGADLPAAFKQIAETIQSRMTVQGKINALTVQGKAQGAVASIVPFVLGVVFYFMDPGYISIYFDSFLGNCVVAFVIVMQIAAYFVIRKIVSINI